MIYAHARAIYARARAIYARAAVIYVRAAVIYRLWCMNVDRANLAVDQATDSRG